MRKFLGIAILLALAYAGFDNYGFDRQGQTADSAGSDVIAAAYRDRKSDIQVTGEGVVVRVLSDDTEGSMHQRFILRLDSGQTLLVAHNIDLAPRVQSISEGDTVKFNGEYEWNSKGGVLHWTHHDPQGEHVAGWLKHNGTTYQ